MILVVAGFLVYPSTSMYAGFGSGPIYIHRTDCTGSETTLSDCRAALYPYSGSSCSHFRDVTLSCIGMTIIILLVIILQCHYMHYFEQLPVKMVI